MHFVSCQTSGHYLFLWPATWAWAWLSNSILARAWFVLSRCLSRSQARECILFNQSLLKRKKKMGAKVLFSLNYLVLLWAVLQKKKHTHSILFSAKFCRAASAKNSFDGTVVASRFDSPINPFKWIRGDKGLDYSSGTLVWIFIPPFVCRLTLSFSPTVHVVHFRVEGISPIVYLGSGLSRRNKACD